ncbi:hypothetical protein LTR08_005333 [Meristemomyces frigidus]|nr:hypothetical protein LTR08_005333 [Meristemomyces frigidus]
MQHPFQCIASVRLPGEATSYDYLVTACGPRLTVVDVAMGEIASRWSTERAASTTSNGDDDEQSERPKKKQKTSTAAPRASNIIKLIVSPDQTHIVTVTDDKLIRVFGVKTGGLLDELSQRCMPKRPCAIQILPDNATIICGDKFGDVYSLPLLPSDSPVVTEQASAGAAESEVSKKEKEAAFKPSATNLTVHTKRNRKALEAQMAQKDFTNKKEPLKFEHKLLLGHVSMLTDVLYATREVERKHRGYIITADRDEHVRISRGPPQSHIIEGYCMGHTHFVSKLCLIPGTDMLVSGGGDDDLYVWDWPTGKLRRKYEIFGAMLGLPYVGDTVMNDGSTQQAATVGDMSDHKVAVSGLCTAPFTNAKGQQETALLVTCERVPALFVIPVNRLQLVKKYEITQIDLDYPPLDITCIGDIVVISLDGRKDGQYRLTANKLVQPNADDKGHVMLKPDEDTEARLKCLVGSAEGVRADDKELDELFYSVANLRKRGGWVTPGEDVAAEDDPVDAEADPNGTEIVEMEDDATVRKA